jgi:O-antigen ligase
MIRAAESLAPVEPAGSIFFSCFAGFLLLSPLYKAGNRPLPLLLLELAAIGLLFVIVAIHRAPLGLPRALAAAIALLVVYPVVQLVPLPEGIWRALPGHGAYADVLDRFAADGGAHAWRAISIVPVATEYGWLALLPPLACLLGALRLSPAQAARLLLMLAILAGAEGVLGLLQIGPSSGGVLYFGNEEPGQYVAIGTFVNRNHLAALLAMTLPVIVGLIVYRMRPGRHRHERLRSAPPSEAVAKRALLFVSGVIVLVCLLFTRSRAGIATGLLGLGCAAIVLVHAAWARTSRGRVAGYVVVGLVVISIGIALAIGVKPLLGELAPGQLHASADFRWSIYAATLRAAAEFLPFGSGLSTYVDVFPRFQVTDVGGLIDYAHNDYLQAFMEVGLVAPVIVGLLLVVYAARMTELLQRHDARSFTLLQIAAGVGLLPLILHSAVDFSLHMPANAMWFATLAGVMLHRGVDDRSAEVRGHAQQLRHRHGSAEPSPR